MKHYLLIMIYRLMVLEEVDISFNEQTVALKLLSYMYYPEPLFKIYILISGREHYEFKERSRDKVARYTHPDAR